MEDPNDRASEAPISVIVDRNVLPGKTKEFEEYVQKIIEASSRFPGYIGTDVINPDKENRYIVVFRFASKEQLETWTSSQERAYWIHKIDRVIEQPTKLVSLTGLETWFVLSKSNRFSPPPKHKMAVVVYLAISLTLTVFDFFFGDYFASIPIPLKFWATSPFIVIIMTYLSMPILTKAFKKFLFF